MSSWWSGLEPREKWLIQIAIGLTLLVGFWQFALNPALSARADARAAMLFQDAQLAQLQEGYIAKRARGRILAPQAQTTEFTGDAFKVAVTRSATDKGLSITRLQGGGNESVGLVFDTADPRFIFFWLEDVETRLGGRVNRLTLEQSGDDMVRARIDVYSSAAGGS